MNMRRAVYSDTVVNVCYGSGYILGQGDDRRWSACADCEWFGRWVDAPEWVKDMVRANYVYDDGIQEVTE